MSHRTVTGEECGAKAESFFKMEQTRGSRNALEETRGSGGRAEDTGEVRQRLRSEVGVWGVAHPL